MNNETKRKFEANIKAINKDLARILGEQIPNEELIKLQFDGIKILIDDCENLVLNEK